MAVLLVVHHTPGRALPRLLEAVSEGTAAPGLESLTVESLAALDADPEPVLRADGYVLVTPANLGYMAGALKHFFDVVYPAALDHTAGRAVGLVVHGESDTTGAVDGVTRIVTGLRWRWVSDPLSVIGPVGPADVDAARELGSVVAATTLGF